MIDGFHFLLLYSQTIQLSCKSNLFLLVPRTAVYHEAENLKYYVIEIKTTFEIPC